MSIIRITGEEHITEIEKGWTVFTDEFEAYAGQFSHFTAKNGTVFGTPEKDKDEKLQYFKEGWWSSDAEGNNRITEAKVGETVYFNLEMQHVTEEKKIFIKLYDYDGANFFPDEIEIVRPNPDGTKSEITSVTLNGTRASLPLTLSQGIENFAQNEENDEIELYFENSYESDSLIKLPQAVENYLTVHTCDKKVVKSYKDIGYGRCEFYQFRYNDFMRRHKDCGHVPPNYYYGPMLKMNEATTKFFEIYALTKEMKEAVGMSTAQIKAETRNGVEAKPLLSHSYGFKYCVRFTHVLNPKLSPQGKEWLSKARHDLQELMEIGLIEYAYEAVYDKIIKSMESTFNKNFEPTDYEKNNLELKELKKIRKEKREKYYKNIELINHRFQEFAFATHPDAYNPKAMSELPIKDLALVGLSPDFKEWMGDGAYGTWLQAAIVAGNMDYDTLLLSNIEYYRQEENSILIDAWKVIKEAAEKIVGEVWDVVMEEDVTEFVNENSIKNGK